MTRVRLYDSGFRELNSPAGAVGRGVAKAAGRTRDRAKDNLTQAGRVDTGTLRQSLRSEKIEETLTRVVYRVGTSLPSGIYNEKGTEMVAPIRPRRARVLRFKGRSGMVFAKQVRGISATRFLTRALRRLTVKDFEV